MNFVSRIVTVVASMFGQSKVFALCIRMTFSWRADLGLSIGLSRVRERHFLSYRFTGLALVTPDREGQYLS
jgi:hypothetical protein